MWFFSFFPRHAVAREHHSLSRLISLILHKKIYWQKQEIVHLPNWMHCQIYTRLKLVRRVAKPVSHWFISLKTERLVEEDGCQGNFKNDDKLPVSGDRAAQSDILH